MATEYATLTFIAETDSLVAAEKRLNSVARTGARTQKSVKNISTSASAAGRSFGGMGRNAGQAGVQIQQLVGQVQAGTNPMVALSQQAADLGFVLGVPLVGAVAGLASAIAGPLISSLFNGSDALADFRDDIEESIDKFNELTEREQQIFIRDTEQRIASQREELRSLQSQIEEAEAAIDRFSLAGRAIAAQRERDRLDELSLQFGELKREVESSEEALKSARDSLSGTNDETDEASSSGQRFVDRLREQADTLGMARSEVLLYKAAQLDLTDAQMLQVRLAAERIRQYEAEQQAIKDQREAEAQARREAIEAERQAEEERRQREQERIEREREKQAAINELESQGLLGREENELESLQRRREQLERFRQQDLISERQYQEASRKLEQDTMQAKVGIVGDSLNQLGKINEDAFKAAKAFNIAQAIMNTYTGATKALATYPPPFNYIAAAGVVAAGLAQVSQIRSQSYSGRAVGGQTRAGESYVVGERGPEVLTMGSSNGRVIPNEALRRAEDADGPSRTTNVTFNINTVDARGFDQLLQSRRGQIISMINSASNDKGRRSVV